MNVVVIGLGSMGKRRIRLMKEMKLPVDIIGIDSELERCNAAKCQFDIECCASIEEAEKLLSIDCAFICTSPLTHANLITLCLTHGYHVFTEINLVSDKYDENIALAQAKGLTLFLSSTPIYRDEMREITRQVQLSSGPMAYLYHVGQYLPDWHPWEQYKDFFASEQKTNGCREIFAIELPWIVKAFGKIVKVHVISQKLTKLDLRFPDIYGVQLIHETGHIGTLVVDIVCRKPVRKLEVYNEEIYLEWEGTPQTLRMQNLTTGELESIECGTYYNKAGYSQFVNEYAYVNELKEFFEVLNGKAPEYDMESDAEILKVIDEIEGA